MRSLLNGFQSVGVIGVGVVGGAVRHYFESQGVPPLLYDPAKRLGSLAEINAAGLVFVCVPTPYAPGHGFDDSAVEQAIAPLRGSKTIVIKSTVLPGTTRKFQERFPEHRVLFNPEFLRERSAVEDFLKPDRQIVGVCGDDREEAERLLKLLPPAPHTAVVPAEAAELTKYATNAFLALKVTFANELYDLCAALGADYGLVKEGIAVDERIGASHLDVLDGGYRGYGGKCLPKDTMALLDLADDLGVVLDLLKAAHGVNLRLNPPVPLRRRPELRSPARAEAESKVA